MPQRRRYATRDELVTLLAPYLSSLDELFPEGDYKYVDVASAAIDALAEMGAPVEALVVVMVNEDVAPDLQ